MDERAQKLMVACAGCKDRVEQQYVQEIDGERYCDRCADDIWDDRWAANDVYAAEYYGEAD